MIRRPPSFPLFPYPTLFRFCSSSPRPSRRRSRRPPLRFSHACSVSISDGSDPTRSSIARSEEHTSELQSPCNLVCRLLLEKKKQHRRPPDQIHAHTARPALA